MISKYVNFKWFYYHPTISLILLSIISNIYLIYDYGIINRSAIQMLWSLSSNIPSEEVTLSFLVKSIKFITGLSYINSAHLLMILVYTGISFILLRIAQLFDFSITTQWCLIFLLLSHPNFNDFRRYIIIEPLFWLLWLLAIYMLLNLYKSSTIISITLWLAIFLLATNITIAAWFWLLLFPFGALLWKPWRNKSVSYALLGYAAIVTLLLFLPIHDGESPYRWFKNSIIANPEPLFNALKISNNNWVKEDDIFMHGIFVISGAVSLILVRVAITLSFICVLLTIYSTIRKQYNIIKYEYLKIIVYTILFDLFITVILLLIDADNNSVLSFSTIFLLLLFSSIGLSYIFKRYI